MQQEVRYYSIEKSTPLNGKGFVIDKIYKHNDNSSASLANRYNCKQCYLEIMYGKKWDISCTPFIKFAHSIPKEITIYNQPQIDAQILFLLY